MTRLFANANYDFIGARRYAYGVTAAILIPGLLFLILAGLNYSIEFTGGTLVQIRSQKTVDVAQLRSGLDQQGIHGAEIQGFGAPNEYVIRETTLPDGTVIAKITGNLAVELTNLSTGEMRTYQINGPGTATFYPDGSFSVEAAGPNLYWTLPENLPEIPAGVPTLSYTTGYIAFAVDANGRTTSYVHHGATTDVCAQLA